MLKIISWHCFFKTPVKFLKCYSFMFYFMQLHNKKPRDVFEGKKHVGMNHGCVVHVWISVGESLNVFNVSFLTWFVVFLQQQGFFLFIEWKINNKFDFNTSETSLMNTSTNTCKPTNWFVDICKLDEAKCDESVDVLTLILFIVWFQKIQLIWHFKCTNLFQ